MARKRKRTKKKSKNKGTRKEFSSLDKHRRHGTKLRTELSEMGWDLIDWERDLVPEHLWLAALADTFTLGKAHEPYSTFLDALDEFWDGDWIAFGLLSDFGALSEARRTEFKEKHRDLIRDLFHVPVGRVLAFYPDCPAAWLIDKEVLDDEGHLDPEVELGRLRRLITRLLPGKDDYAGHLRALPLGRAFKHDKVEFTERIEATKLFPKYPGDCTEEEQYRVQSTARSSLNMMHGNIQRFQERVWPKYFWRHNHNLATCRSTAVGLGGSAPQVPEPEIEALCGALRENASAARAYLERLSTVYKYDLYDPDRDQILLGLFSRATRLFVVAFEDPNLWARDLGGIVLRCLVDTAITFSYLAQKATPDEFRKFREYGEGQEKLLMLHLQATYEGQRSLEGREASDIAGDLGGVMPELIDIELGHWTKKDSRKLAMAVGMERFYRLVYSPTSNDMHGSWMSLKHSNLHRCAEPLHRFHRIPSVAEPPAYLGLFVALRDLILECITVGRSRLAFPDLERPFPELPGVERDSTPNPRPFATAHRGVRADPRRGLLARLTEPPGAS